MTFFKKYIIIILEIKVVNVVKIKRKDGNEKMRKLFTDGSCSKNPGPGGYGVVLIEDNEIKYIHHEQCEYTTNNREELKAILHAFQYACNNFRFEDVLIYCDSAYCVNMINDWIWTWARNGWKNSKKKEVENIDLVKQIYKYLTMEFFPCQVIKTSAHCGIAGNELADALATFDNNKYQKILSTNDLVEHFVEKNENL